MPLTSTLIDRIAGLNEGVPFKANCRIFATSNHSLNGLAAFGGNTPVEGERVLLPVQTDETQSGIWLASSGAWSRSPDFDGSRDIVCGTLVQTFDPASPADARLWRVVTPNPIVLGTSAITFNVVPWFAEGWVTPYHFGATGLGYPNNDHDAFQAALDSGQNVIVPDPLTYGGPIDASHPSGVAPGDHYFIRGSLDVPEGVDFVGLHKPKLIIFNEGGRGIRLNSNTSIDNFKIEMHDNKTYPEYVIDANVPDVDHPNPPNQQVANTHYTVGCGAVWMGDVYSPTDTDIPLTLTENVRVTRLEINSQQWNYDYRPTDRIIPPPTPTTFQNNPGAIHGIDIWGYFHNVVVEQVKIFGRYVSYFAHADWGTSRPTGGHDASGVPIHPYDDIWHPDTLTMRNLWLIGDYTWLTGAGLPATPNGLSFSNPRNLVVENVHIKDVAEAVWVKMGDAGTAVTTSDIPKGSELCGMFFRNIYIENAYGFGIQVSNKSYADGDQGLATMGADVAGIQLRFENCTIVRGATENAKGCLLLSAYFTANVYFDVNIVWPVGVVLPSIGYPVRVVTSRNVELHGRWEMYGSGLLLQNIIDVRNHAIIVNPGQDRNASYPWTDNTYGINIVGGLSSSGGEATTTLAANLAAGAATVSLTSLPWDLTQYDAIFTANQVIYVNQDYTATGSPIVLEIWPDKENLRADIAGATVYHERAIHVTANALLSATSIAVDQIPWDALAGTLIYRVSDGAEIELAVSVVAKYGAGTIQVKPLPVALTAGDVLQLERTAQNITISNGRVEGFRTGINLEGSSGSFPRAVKIENMMFVRNGIYDVLVEGGGHIVLSHNKHKLGNRANNASGVNIRFAAAPTNVIIDGNVFEYENGSQVRYNVQIVDLSTNIMVINNSFLGYDATKTTPSCIFSSTAAASVQNALFSGNYFKGGLTKFSPATAAYVTNIGDVSFGIGSAAPTTGTWATGSVVFARGGGGGWVCTSGGAPGTWTVFAWSGTTFVIGTNIQAWDTDLDALAALTYAADKIAYFTGAHTAATTTLSAFGRTLIDDADAATARATLGASVIDGTGGAQFTAPVTVSIAGGSANGFTISGESTTAATIVRSSADSAQPSAEFRKSRGTIAAPAVAQSSDKLGSINWTGRGNTGWIPAAELRSSVIAATPSDTDMQCRMQWLLTASGAAATSEFARWEYDTGLSMYGANVIVNQNRHYRPRQYAAASLPAQNSGDVFMSSDTLAWLVSDGTQHVAPGQRVLIAVTANTTTSIPTGYAIDEIYFNETANHAVTGGIKIGTTNGGTEVVAAQAVGALSIGAVADSALLLKLFSRSGATTLYIQAVGAWNSASVDFSFTLRKVF